MTMGSSKGKGKGAAGRKAKGGRGGTHPWINSQIIQASENKDVGHLMNVIMQHLPQMNLVNLSTALHRVAKIVGNDAWLQGQLRQNSSLDTLLNSVCTALNVVEATEVQPQSVSNVVWSLATLRIVHRPLLQVISLVCVSNMAQFKSFELSTTLWALAKLGSMEDSAPVDKAVFYAAATHIHNNVNDFGFRCLATTAWAFATAKQRHARLFRSMAAAMLPAAAGANCQEMANTAWAFGTADFHDDALFQELAEQAIHRLEEFKPQEISNMLWGFATNSFFHEGFYARAGAVAQNMELQSQHLANILWAFARVRPKHPLTQQTVLALLPVCTRQLATFKPQEVSSTLLATAKAVGSGDEMTPLAPTLANFRQEVLDFFHACLPWVVARLRDFSEQSLANSVSAYAMVPVRGSETLVECAGQEVSKRMKDLDVNALVHLLKGFSLFPTSNSSVKIVKVLADSIATQLDKVRAQEMQSLGRLLNRGAAQRELHFEEIHKRLVSLAQNVQIDDTQVFPQPPGLASGAKVQQAPQIPQVSQVPQVPQIVVNPQTFPQVQLQVDQAPQLQVQATQAAMAQQQAQLPQQVSSLSNVTQMPQAGTSVEVAPSGMEIQASNLAEMQALAMEAQSQGRRAQMNRLLRMPQHHHSAARGRMGHEDDFLHQHPLCPISESGMMAAMANCNSWEGAVVQGQGCQGCQGANYPATPLLGNTGATSPLPCQGFMMDEVPASSTTMGTAPALGMHSVYPALGIPATSFPGMPDAMMMMPAGQVPHESMVSMPKPPARNNWETSHKLFVKNSFLHVEDSDEEEDDWNCDGTSSHRSSSMPSRISRDKEDRLYNRLPPAEMLELLYSLRNKPAAAHGGGAEGPTVSPILSVITEGQGATSSTQSAASYSGST